MPWTKKSFVDARGDQKYADEIEMYWWKVGIDVYVGGRREQKYVDWSTKSKYIGGRKGQKYVGGQRYVDGKMRHKCEGGKRGRILKQSAVVLESTIHKP